MPRRTRADLDAIAVLLAPGRAVASHRQLQELGMPLSTITSRIGPRGPWQRALPGVVFGHTGTPTRYERQLAALRFAGDGGVLTGVTALAELGVALPRELDTHRVHVLVPHTSQRSSYDYVDVHRTRRPPRTVLRRGMACAGVARAVIDAAREIPRVDVVRELVAAAVQQRRCSPEQLLDEVRATARQRTAHSRRALEEVLAGVRSLAEARLRGLVGRAGLPAPEWNAALRDRDGAVIAVVDALWRAEGVALELDSMAWHLSPAAYRATQARQRRIALEVRVLLPIAPHDVSVRGEELSTEIRRALGLG